ncbi:hypothetical protein CLOM_g22753 [Closterium sp. NIES-68]|nr:hypothetical protein CLOM_g22753 [Closterium sp. NIES-68]GJP60568.1 hypothetical protein CLOP_g17808 [Closterium sp. NIES-67]
MVDRLTHFYGATHHTTDAPHCLSPHSTAPALPSTTARLTNATSPGRRLPSWSRSQPSVGSSAVVATVGAEGERQGGLEGERARDGELLGEGRQHDSETSLETERSLVGPVAEESRWGGAMGRRSELARTRAQSGTLSLDRRAESVGSRERFDGLFGARERSAGISETKGNRGKAGQPAESTGERKGRWVGAMGRRSESAGTRARSGTLPLDRRTESVGRSERSAGLVRPQERMAGRETCGEADEPAGPTGERKGSWGMAMGRRSESARSRAPSGTLPLGRRAESVGRSERPGGLSRTPERLSGKIGARESCGEVEEPAEPAGEREGSWGMALGRRSESARTRTQPGECSGTLPLDRRAESMGARERSGGVCRTRGRLTREVEGRESRAEAEGCREYTGERERWGEADWREERCVERDSARGHSGDMDETRGRRLESEGARERCAEVDGGREWMAELEGCGESVEEQLRASWQEIQALQDSEKALNTKIAELQCALRAEEEVARATEREAEAECWRRMAAERRVAALEREVETLQSEMADLLEQASEAESAEERSEAAAEAAQSARRVDEEELRRAREEVAELEEQIRQLCGSAAQREQQFRLLISEMEEEVSATHAMAMVAIEREERADHALRALRLANAQLMAELRGNGKAHGKALLGGEGGGEEGAGGERTRACNENECEAGSVDGSISLSVSLSSSADSMSGLCSGCREKMIHGGPSGKGARGGRRSSSSNTSSSSHSHDSSCSRQSAAGRREGDAAAERAEGGEGRGRGKAGRCRPCERRAGAAVREACRAEGEEGVRCGGMWAEAETDEETETASEFSFHFRGAGSDAGEASAPCGAGGACGREGSAVFGWEEHVEGEEPRGSMRGRGMESCSGLEACIERMSGGQGTRWRHEHEGEKQLWGEGEAGPGLGHTCDGRGWGGEAESDGERRGGECGDQWGGSRECREEGWARVNAHPGVDGERDGKGQKRHSEGHLRHMGHVAKRVGRQAGVEARWLRGEVGALVRDAERVCARAEERNWLEQGALQLCVALKLLLLKIRGGGGRRRGGRGNPKEQEEQEEEAGSLSGVLAEGVPVGDEDEWSEGGEEVEEEEEEEETERGIRRSEWWREGRPGGDEVGAEGMWDAHERPMAEGIAEDEQDARRREENEIRREEEERRTEEESRQREEELRLRDEELRRREEELRRREEEERRRVEEKRREEEERRREEEREEEERRRPDEGRRAEDERARDDARRQGKDARYGAGENEDVEEGEVLSEGGSEEGWYESAAADVEETPTVVAATCDWMGGGGAVEERVVPEGGAGEERAEEDSVGHGEEEGEESESEEEIAGENMESEDDAAAMHGEEEEEEEDERENEEGRGGAESSKGASRGEGWSIGVMHARSASASVSEQIGSREEQSSSSAHRRVKSVAGGSEKGRGKQVAPGGECEHEGAQQGMQRGPSVQTRHGGQWCAAGSERSESDPHDQLCDGMGAEGGGGQGTSDAWEGGEAHGRHGEDRRRAIEEMAAVVSLVPAISSSSEGAGYAKGMGVAGKGGGEGPSAVLNSRRSLSRLALTLGPSSNASTPRGHTQSFTDTRTLTRTLTNTPSHTPTRTPTRDLSYLTVPGSGTVAGGGSAYNGSGSGSEPSRLRKWMSTPLLWAAAAAVGATGAGTAGTGAKGGGGGAGGSEDLQRQLQAARAALQQVTGAVYWEMVAVLEQGGCKEKREKGWREEFEAMEPRVVEAAVDKSHVQVQEAEKLLERAEKTLLRFTAVEKRSRKLCRHMEKKQQVLVDLQKILLQAQGQGMHRKIYPEKTDKVNTSCKLLWGTQVHPIS